MHLSTLILTCAAVLSTAGCDGEPLDDSDIAGADAPFEAGQDFVPPVSEPAVPYQTIEQDGTLIVDGDDFRVRIHRSRRVAELNVSRDQLAQWFAIPFSRWSPQATQRLYRVFADDFDFIVFVPPSEGQHIAILADGTSTRVRNDIEGLGMSLFDKTAWYGSSGRLQSTVLLGGIDHVVAGPSLRELGERWGNNTFIPTGYPDHFGFSDVGGQLGGCAPDQIEPLGHSHYFCDFNGTTDWSPDGANHNDRPYAQLELYLMGLVPPEAVPPTSWAEDGEWVDPDLGIFEGSLKTADIDDLRGIHGKRAPAYDESQTQFRTLFVVVSGGELLDLPLFNRFDVRVAEFAAPESVPDQAGMFNFFEATSGLASLDAEDLDASLL